MFSWSDNSSSKNSSYPGRRLQAQRASASVTPIQGSIRPPSLSQNRTRKQHLASYIEDPTLKRSTRRVSPDDTTYDTVFQTTHGDTLILRINIPLESSFSSSCPVMTLAGCKVQHPWINNDNRNGNTMASSPSSSNKSAMRVTGYAPIQSESSWKQSKLLLGAAVHDVVKHFQLNPPKLVEITDKGLRSIQSKKSSSNGNGINIRSPPRSGNSISTNSTKSYGYSDGSNDIDNAPPSYNVIAETTPAPAIPMPRVPTNFTETDQLTREGLDELIEKDLLFETFVKQGKIYKEIYGIGSSLLKENSSIVADNLKQAETIRRELRNEIKDLHEMLKKKFRVYTELENEQNAICAPPGIRSTLKQLHKAKKEAFEESEVIAEDWVKNGDRSVNDFCDQFLSQRKIHHIWAAKMELLQQLS